jgi:hypothetical protein
MGQAALSGSAHYQVGDKLVFKNWVGFHTCLLNVCFFFYSGMDAWERLLDCDWIVRNPDTFVHRGDFARLGWEESRKTACSSFLRGETTELNLLTRGYRLIRKVASIICGNNDVPITFHPKKSFTNGFAIFVSTDAVDEPLFTAAEKLDILLGIGIHESAHMTEWGWELFALSV